MKKQNWKSNLKSSQVISITDTLDLINSFNACLGNCRGNFLILFIGQTSRRLQSRRYASRRILPSSLSPSLGFKYLVLDKASAVGSIQSFLNTSFNANDIGAVNSMPVA